MYLIHIEQPGQAPRQVTLSQLPCRIGRGRECEVVLPSWRVARVHAEMHHGESGMRLLDRGSLTGTQVNGLRRTEWSTLTPDDEIEIAGYRLRYSHLSSVVEHETVGQHPERLRGAMPPTPSEDRLFWRRQLHHKLLETLDLQRRDLNQAEQTALRHEIHSVVAHIMDTEMALPEHIDRAALLLDVVDEAVGLGPLERIFEDPSIGEIMVNAADDIWVERGGCLEKYPAAFSDNTAVRSIIDRIVAPLGRRIDEASPMVDARMADGSRVNAIIPPLAIRGPTLTIRRFNRQVLSPQDLIAAGAASVEMLDFLKICVEQRRNIVISGGTSSGKTTLLNVLSNLIPHGERIVTIEDAAELQLQAEHLVALEARPANLEQRGAVSIRDLVRNALRMRPDRIVVGECRGGECLDMLQAMNTGHDGSLTTLHANSPRDVVSRLEVMTLMAGIEIPVQAIREQIAAAVDIVVHQSRFSDGRRRIVSIMEVTGMEAGRIQMQTLFKFEPRLSTRGASTSGQFVGCGNIPEFYEPLRAAGLDLSVRAFTSEAHDV